MMMNDVFHLRSSVGMYGAEHMLLGLLSQQHREGKKAGLIAFSGPLPPTLVETARQRGLPVLPQPCRGPLDVACLASLRQHLATHRPAILHCHDYKSIVYGVLATRGLPTRLVATLHGWLPETAKLRLYHLAERQALRRFHRICAVSPVIQGALLEAGIPGDRILRVPNGVDTELFHPCPRPPSEDGILRIGVAARLSPEKNLIQLIHAIEACASAGRPVHLEIVGDGPQRAQLEEVIEDTRQGSSIKLIGHQASLAKWYPTLDAFILPSLAEGMPMTVLEALSCGVPVIASRTGSIPALLSHMPSCQLVRPGCPEELVRAIQSQPLLMSPVQALRQRVEERYSLARMQKEYDCAYAQACGE